MDFFSRLGRSLDRALSGFGAPSVEGQDPQPMDSPRAGGSLTEDIPDMGVELPGQDRGYQQSAHGLDDMWFRKGTLTIEDHPWFGKQELTEEAFAQAMREAIQEELAELPGAEPADGFQGMDLHHDQQQTSLEDIIEQTMPQLEEPPEEQEDPWEL